MMVNVDVLCPLKNRTPVNMMVNVDVLCPLINLMVNVEFLDVVFCVFFFRTMSFFSAQNRELFSCTVVKSGLKD